MEQSKTFGVILEDLMKTNRISARFLAQQIKLSPKTVAEWVGSGGRIPRNPQHIKSIAKFFGVTVHQLLYGEDENIKNTEAFPLDGVFEIKLTRVNQKVGCL